MTYSRRSYRPRRGRGLDKIDELLLSILREESRLPFVEIASKVNLSEAAVRRRVSNLIKTGVIRKFTIEVNEPQLTSAITYVSVSPTVPTSEVSKRIRSASGVETIYETTGPFDIAVILKGSNIAEINRSVEEIRRLNGVLNTNTTIILRTIR